MHKNTPNWAGRRFTRLVAVYYISSHLDETGKKITGKWFCKCDCGNTISVASGNLSSGNTKSCGCLCEESRKKSTKTHGLRNHPLYNVWNSMKNRCNNKNSKDYPRYGGRGIKVCERWNNSFECFWSDMGKGWESGLTIERIDNNGPYSPENCKFSSRKTQANNRSSNAIISTIYGDITIAEASKISGIKEKTIWMRKNTYKWPDKDLLIPVS